MRITLVHNPNAGDGRHGEAALRQQLAEAGHEVARTVSDKRVAGRLKEPADLVVVAGGDGSVKRVAVALAGSRVPMAILPLGTANNIAKSLGILGCIPELAAGWAAAHRQLVRLGTASTADGTARFVESVGVGVFTELITRGRSEVDEGSTGLTGHAIDRALLLLERIAREHPARPRRLTLDGDDLSGEYLVVEAMHMALIGPNVPLAPAADCSDDLLDVVTVSERERGRLADYARARLTGAAAGLELPMRLGRQLSMEASPEELHVDDDRWEPEATGDGSRAELRDGEVRIAMDASAVEVLVPGNTRG